MNIQKVDFRKQKRKILLIAIPVLLLLFIAGIFLFGRIRNVSVVGCEFYTEGQIKEKIMRDSITNNTLGLYLTYAMGKGEEIPFVGKISVKMTGIDSVEIVVYEKKIVACFQYMSEYLYFDQDGVVVESSTEKKENVPLVEGVTFLKMNLYEKMEVEEEDIFETILGISQLLEKYQVETDKVVFDRKKAVTLYSGKIQIKLGKKDMYDEQIAELSKLLPKAKKKKLKGVLDMENFEEGQDKIIFQKED